LCHHSSVWRGSGSGVAGRRRWWRRWCAAGPTQAMSIGGQGSPMAVCARPIHCPGLTGSVGNTACSCAARTGAAGVPGFTMRVIRCWEPLFSECYDHHRHVLFSWYVPELLWRRFHHHAPVSPSRSPSSYRRSCADERACQGWRSHHVVTPKAPLLVRSGSQIIAPMKSGDGALRSLLGIR
jgi:hypothetical protein